MSNTAGNIISKIVVAILVGLLILSFAFWGVGDIFRGRVSNVVATVGGEPITREEHRHAIATEADNLSRQLGGNVPQETLKALGVEQRALSRLVSRKLVEIEANNRGIRASDAQIKMQMRADSRFVGNKGVFDKQAFSNFLKRYGYSEKFFISEGKKDIEISTLLSAVGADIQVPDIVTRTLYNYENEKRSARLLVISPDAVDAPAEPAQEELQAFYDERKEEFAAPEYRAITYLTINAENVRDEIDTSDEILRAQYDMRSDEFAVPETRNLEQIVVMEQDKAQVIYDRLKAGDDFYEIAKSEAKLDKEAVDYGEVTLDELAGSGAISQADAGKIFALVKGGFTAPLESDFGFHIFRVTAVKPAHTEPFEEVSKQIKQEIIEEEAADLLYELTTGLEDELAGGSGLEEAAKNINATVRNVEHIDITGKTQSGEFAGSLPDFGDFVGTAFKQLENIESEIVSSEDGMSYFILRVDDVIDARIRPLEEVSVEVTDVWKKEKHLESLKAFAEETAGKIVEAGDFDKVAENNGITIEDSEEFYRSSNMEDIPPALVQEVFGLDKGAASTAHMRPDGKFVIAELAEIIPPQSKEDIVNAMETRLKNEYEDDLIVQYIDFLQRRYPVENLTTDGS